MRVSASAEALSDSARVRDAAAGDLAALLGHGLTEEVVAQLGASHRLGSRLREAAERRLGAPPIPTGVWGAALALDRAGLRRLQVLAGAVWHAAVFAQVVDGAARRALVLSLGVEAHAAALAGRALAPPAEAGDGRPPESLVATVEWEGACCWTAWRASWPRPVASRLALLGGGGRPTPRHEAFGPGIVEWLLGRI